MMKTMNHLAIAFAVLAIQFGLQNCATAQTEQIYPGSFKQRAPGQELELIPSWDLHDIEKSLQSFTAPQNAPEEINERSYDQMPFPQGQQNFAYEANQNQRPPNRVHAQQSNWPERSPYRRSRLPNLNYQASYQDAGQVNPPSENRIDRSQRFGANRQEFVGPEFQAARPGRQPHHGGCHGRRGSGSRAEGFHRSRENGQFPQAEGFQFDRPLPNEFPNNEADLPPSLKIPISRFHDISY